MLGINVHVEVDEFGTEFRRDLVANINGNLKAAAKFFMMKCKQAVSKPYPPASAPGDPPHLRTGAGRESIIMIEGYSVGLGERPTEYYVTCDESIAWYMIPLEFGQVPRVEPRPWMQPTFDRNLHTILNILYFGR